MPRGGPPPKKNKQKKEEKQLLKLFGSQAGQVPQAEQVLQVPQAGQVLQAAQVPQTAQIPQVLQASQVLWAPQVLQAPQVLAFRPNTAGQYAIFKPDEIHEEAKELNVKPSFVIQPPLQPNANQYLTPRDNPIASGDVDTGRTFSFKKMLSRKKDTDVLSITSNSTIRSSEFSEFTNSTNLSMDSAASQLYSRSNQEQAQQIVDCPVTPATPEREPKRSARAGPPPKPSAHSQRKFDPADPPTSLLSKLKLKRRDSRGSLDSESQSSSQHPHRRSSIDTSTIMSTDATIFSYSESVPPTEMAGYQVGRQVAYPSPSQVYPGGQNYHVPAPPLHMLPIPPSSGPLPVTTNNALKQRHMIPKMSFDGLVTSRFAAPIEEICQRGARVLDIGCGSGSWIMDLAMTYPSSHFLGTDISLMLLDDMPDNCSISLVNSLKFPLPFADNTFDFVRHHFGLSVPSWLELAESDMWLRRAGPTCERINQIVRSLLLSKELDPLMSRGLTTLLQDETEFASVNGSQSSVPVGWDGAQGAHMRNNFLRFLNDIRPLVVAGSSVSDSTITNEEWDMLLTRAAFELSEDSGQKCLLNWWVAYGKKPE
ncbi:hypothetical protein BC937DRAFT_94850 [Endogone sp. FLAS-F59071]|nr:hypothetical protein BC937DRAFT_94850 [Endogone sp. FLAS-F59071]|eukprot:RUS20598.1 hypothetical protein BC937DRAFT_94850 [Endogone sp. FLAS-F59071]